MRALAGRLVARPVHPLEELLSRRGQHRLPVRDRDQAELRIEVTAVLQVDQQIRSFARTGKRAVRARVVTWRCTSD